MRIVIHVCQSREASRALSAIRNQHKQLRLQKPQLLLLQQQQTQLKHGSKQWLQ